MTVTADDIPEEYRKKFNDLCEEIVFLKKFAKGANGVTLRGVNKLLGRPVVVKFYYYGDGAHVEPALLAKLESPNILKVDTAGAIDAEYAYFVTRYCENGDLDDFLNGDKISIREAVEIIKQVAYGCSFLHGQGYVHRDLKPSNIFQNVDGSYVIGDFGSVVRTHDKGYANALTKHSIIYRPPEDFDDSNSYFRQGDVYQIGICLYQVLRGYFPYEIAEWLTPKEKKALDSLNGSDASIFADRAIETKIKRGKVLNLSTLPHCVPGKLRRIIKKATHLDKRKRYQSIADLLADLNNADSHIVNWRFEDGVWTAHAHPRSYRFFKAKNGIVVEKRKHAGSWRKERNLSPTSDQEAVSCIIEAIS